MNHIQRYLTEEVVEDYADGIVSRREALRQLGLLGVAGATAFGLLAACGGPADPANPAGPPAAPPTQASPSPQLTDRPAVATQEITFAGPGRTLAGSYAAAATPHGAVLVVHDNRGLSGDTRGVVSVLAGSGFAALAIDLLSEEGGTGAFASDSGAVAGALSRVPLDRFVADMRAALSELEIRAPGAGLGAVGFCFGGGMVWSLLDAGEPRLRAAAPFYGPQPDRPDYSGSPHAAVLGVYAEQDSRINASRDTAEAALTAAGLTHELVTYPGVNHGFFNVGNARFEGSVAAQAYQKLTDWLDRYLAG